jgi:hypothetical protein
MSCWQERRARERKTSQQASLKVMSDEFTALPSIEMFIFVVVVVVVGKNLLFDSPKHRGKEKQVSSDC